MADAGVPPRSGNSNRPAASGLTTTLLVLLGVCCVISISVNMLHGDTFVHHHPDMALSRAMKDFMKGRPPRRDVADTMEAVEHELEVESKAEVDDATVTDKEAPDEEQENEEAPDEEQENEEEVNEEEEDKNNPHNAEIENDGEGETEEVPENDAATTERVPTKLGGLKCDKWGGPDAAAAEELAYWSDIPSDQDYVSPFRVQRGQHKKYMTFEPDGGGWNNIRMAMETVVGLAVAMGRTLVLPPAQGMYLLGKDKSKQNTHFSFADFFPMHEMAEENAGLEIITTEQFLLAEAMTGNLIDKDTGEPSFPPHNRTNWDGEDVKPLKEWLRNVTYIEHMWKPGDCLAAFPASGDHKDVLALEKMQKTVVERGLKTDHFLGNPADVDGDPLERMHENIAGRNKLCVYDEVMQNQLVVHFMCYHKMRIRYLVHFYAFLYFEDWRQDLWMKRFMRDHMRYMDEIQCAAARVVEKVRERSRQFNPEMNGAFDTFHIRRGDFQFKTTRISADQILANSKEVLNLKKTIFIATDERDKKFFKPMTDLYDVVFLDDFMHVLTGVNTNYFGMIDQLVAAKGDVFVGCWFSTFTGFINRMRGYYSTKYKLPGYENGTLPTTYYYATLDKKYQMHDYRPLGGGFFNREYPTSWRQIDTGVGEMPK